MSAHSPRDPQLTAPVPPAATPSVRDLLAACAAARALSTPPPDEPTAARTDEKASENAPGRDAA